MLTTHTYGSLTQLPQVISLETKISSTPCIPYCQSKLTYPMGNLSLQSNMAEQHGTINIKVMSDPRWGLKDVPIALTDVIYASKLKSNLLLVGRMTNSNVNVHFGKHTSWLIFKGRIIAYRPKENNLYTYVAFHTDPRTETTDYTSELSGPTLWHYRLVHTSYHIINNTNIFCGMVRAHHLLYDGFATGCLMNGWALHPFDCTSPSTL